MENSEYNTLIAELRKLVTSYLDKQVITPSLETVETGLHEQGQLISLLLLSRVVTGMVRKKGLDFDKHYLASLPPEEIERRIEVLGRFLESGKSCPLADESVHKDAYDYLVSDSSHKHLLTYLGREIDWIVVSVLSASYISALVLMRSVLELLVSIATRATGSMKERLEAIPFLETTEIKNLLNLWNRLCGWAHPYGRWVKEVCPSYVVHGPMYHPGLCATCLNELQKTVDFFVVIVLEKYEIPARELLSEIQEHNISLAGFELILSRISGYPDNAPECP